jgi:hypothetical protein
MSGDDGTTIGVWIPSGEEDLLADFDALEGSRSRNLRRAMALLVAIDGALEAVGEPLDDWDERALRATVRQAVLDHFRE